MIKVSLAKTTKMKVAYKWLQQSKAFIHTHGYLYIQASMCKTINTNRSGTMLSLPINTWSSWLRPYITYCLLLYLSSMVLYIKAHYTNALKVHWNSTTSKWIMDYREAIHSDYRSHSSPMAVCTKNKEIIVPIVFIVTRISYSNQVSQCQRFLYTTSFLSMKNDEMYMKR